MRRLSSHIVLYSRVRTKVHFSFDRHSRPGFFLSFCFCLMSMRLKLKATLGILFHYGLLRSFKANSNYDVISIFIFSMIFAIFFSCVDVSITRSISHYLISNKKLFSMHMQNVYTKKMKWKKIKIALTILL
jgi:hypothetical protein